MGPLLHADRRIAVDWYVVVAGAELDARPLDLDRAGLGIGRAFDPQKGLRAGPRP